MIDAETMLERIAAADSLGDLEAMRVSALGKSGSITALLKSLGSMDAEARAIEAPKIHALREQVTDAIAARKAALEGAELELKLATERIDLSLPAPESVSGTVNIANVGDVPITSQKTATTKVSVRDHDTIVLGGLIENSSSRSISGVPILMNIPVLGYLFRNTSDKAVRNELIVLIRPTVLPTPLLPLKVVYGSELVQHLLVEGQRVVPRVLVASGYRFEHTEIGDALRAVLAAPAAA